MKKCNICQSGNVHIIKRKITKIDDSIEREYMEKCFNCGNLLFGYVRPEVVNDDDDKQRNRNI